MNQVGKLKLLIIYFTADLKYRINKAMQNQSYNDQFIQLSKNEKQFGFVGSSLV
jgi:hypothetical protein